MCLLKFPCAKLQKRIKKYELRNNIFFLFAHIIYNVSIWSGSRAFAARLPRNFSCRRPCRGIGNLSRLKSQLSQISIKKKISSTSNNLSNITYNLLIIN